MELRLCSEEDIRIATRQAEIFLDVDCLNDEQGLAITLYPNDLEICPYRYIELRQGKTGWLKLFCFLDKETKEYVDLGVWENAKIVWSKNYNQD